MKQKRTIFVINAFFIFTFAGIFITYPLVFHLGDYATGLGDELLIAWIHSWVIHILLSDPVSLFQANLYYPYHNTLAYSDLFLTSSLLSALPTYLIGQPIAANNISLIFSLALLGFSLFLLAYYVTKDFLSSLLAGLLVIFSPAVLSYSVHLQMIEVFWVPLSLLFWILFLQKRKTKYLLACLLCFLLQVYNSFLPGYFIIFSLVILFIFKWFDNKKQTKKLFTRKHVFYVLLAVLLVVPIAIPYFAVSHEFKYVRDIRETIHFALQPEDLLYPGDTTRLKDVLLSIVPTNNYSQNNEFKPGYLGFVFSGLCIFTVFYLWKKRKKIKWHEKSFFTIGMTGIILSLGPFLHLNRQTIHDPFPIPLPYLLFYYLMPGFQGFRNSARWEMLFIMTIAIVIALVISKCIARYSLRKRIVILLLLFGGIVGEFNFPMHFVSVPQIQQFPPVYSWIATTPKEDIIVELPIYNWNTTPYVSNEMLREYYSTMHFRRTVNGYSGFSPPPWQILVTDTLSNFPDRKTSAQLQEIGITKIIIHTDEYDMLAQDQFRLNNKKLPSGKEVIKKLQKEKSLVLTKKFEDTYVYKFNNR